jgi:hypothetical protein
LPEPPDAQPASPAAIIAVMNTLFTNGPLSFFWNFAI